MISVPSTETLPWAASTLASIVSVSPASASAIAAATSITTALSSSVLAEMSAAVGAWLSASTSATTTLSMFGPVVAPAGSCSRSVLAPAGSVTSTVSVVQPSQAEAVALSISDWLSWLLPTPSRSERSSGRPRGAGLGAIANVSRVVTVPPSTSLSSSGRDEEVT